MPSFLLICCQDYFGSWGDQGAKTSNCFHWNDNVWRRRGGMETGGKKDASKRSHVLGSLEGCNIYIYIFPMCRTEMKWNVKVFKHIVNVCKSTACPRLKANQSLYWIWIFLSACCARGKVSVTPWIHSSSGKQQKSINNIFLFLLISVIHLFIYFRVRAKCQFDFDKNGHEYSQGGIWFFFFFTGLLLVLLLSRKINLQVFKTTATGFL